MICQLYHHEAGGEKERQITNTNMKKKLSTFSNKKM